MNLVRATWHKAAPGRLRAIAVIFSLVASALFAAATPAVAAPRPTIWATTDGRPVDVVGTHLDVRFDGEIGAHLLIECVHAGDVTPAFVSVATPSGDGLYNLYACPRQRNVWGTVADLAVLPETGVYSLRLDNSEEFTTTFRFTVVTDTVVSAAADGTQQSLFPDTPRGNVAYEFTGSAGERAFVSCASAATKPLPGGDVVSVGLVLIGPDKKVIEASGHDKRFCFPVSAGYGITGTAVDLALPKSGRYRLVLDYSAVYRRTDATVLRLYRPGDDVSGELSLDGPPVALKTTGPGQNARAAFTLAAGEQAVLACRGGDDGWANTVSTPGGQPLAGPQCGEYGSPPAGGRAIRVAGPGQFTVTIDPDDDRRADITLRLTRIADDATAVVTIGGDPASLQLTTGQRARFTLAVAADTGPVTLTCSQPDTYTSTTARLLGPDGRELTSSYCYSFGKTFEARYFTTPGTYTLVVEPVTEAAPLIKVSAAR